MSLCGNPAPCARSLVEDGASDGISSLQHRRGWKQFAHSADAVV
jgi:hypothetical protein